MLIIIIICVCMTNDSTTLSSDFSENDATFYFLVYHAIELWFAVCVSANIIHQYGSVC